MSTLELNLELWPRQYEAFTTPARELLFGGATEGGKSHFVRVALISWCLAIPGLQCVLIRKKLDDIIKNHVEGPTGFRALLAPLIQIGLVSVTQFAVKFPKGSIISLKHCQDERQFNSAQGVEVHVLAIDEATQISERLIRFFRTWVRMPREMKDKLPDEYKEFFPRIIYTANPIGISVPFFRREFVTRLPGERIEEVAGFTRQYLLSRYTDNLSVDAKDHKGRLEGLGDEALAKALDLGDWNAITGEFFPEWDEKRHVVSDFMPPAHWFRYRTFDWGTAEPFAVYWWAVSDGETFTDSSGVRRWFPRGALVAYQEWYGCDTQDPSKGNRYRNEDIAYGIVQRSEVNHQNLVTLTDSLPFQDRGGDTIAQIFNRCGCPLSLGDTSRVPGWSMMRSRLIGAQLDSNSTHRFPMIYFTASCEAARDYLPALTRHPSEAKKEDAAEHGEATHSCDAIRLACTAHTVIKDMSIPSQVMINAAVKSKNTMKTLFNDSGIFK